MPFKHDVFIVYSELNREFLLNYNSVPEFECSKQDSSSNLNARKSY